MYAHVDPVTPASMFDVVSYHKSLCPRTGHSIIASTKSFLSCLRSSGLLFMITHKARATGKKVEGVGAMRDKELKLVAVNASRTLVERQGRVQGEENGEGVDATC